MSLKLIFVHRGDSNAAALGFALEQAGVTLLHASTVGEAVALLDTGVGAVVADVDVSGEDSLTLLERVAGESSHLPFLLRTEEETDPVRVDALRLGADDVWLKRLPLEEQVARVQRALRWKTEIDRLVAESRALRRLAVTDGLTQLHNYRHFQERLMEEFRRAGRYGDPLSVILLDLDHFKEVNDRFGHATGDLVLRHVAQLLQRNVRDTDLLARYGGEEFVVLLPKTTQEGARIVAERIARDVEYAQVEGAHGVTLTASLGVATHPLPSFDSSSELVQAADHALYEAKRCGRNRVCTFLPGPESDAALATGQAASPPGT